MNRYGEPDFKYIWNKIKQTGVAGESAYEYAVEAGYTGTEEQFAQDLAQVSTKADDGTVVHKAETETITGTKTFTQKINGTTALTEGIPFGKVDSTSTATAFTATVAGITELKDGTTVMLWNGVKTSTTDFTININGLGAKHVYSNMGTGYSGQNPTKESSIFNINYTMIFVYSTTIVSGGAWICYRGYAPSNSIGYQIRTNSKSLPSSAKFYRYRLLFTSADREKYVPANTSTSTNATALRDVNQTKIDPFGEIVYYGTTTVVYVGERPSVTQLWTQYVLTLGYSFNRTGSALTLTSWKPVYIKCAPQDDGSAIIDATTPYVQALPTTEDGKIYIFLGIAYSATQVELMQDHPIYCFKDGMIQLWTSAPDFQALTNTEIENLINSVV